VTAGERRRGKAAHPILSQTNQGFSLIEALVALIIAAMALTGVIELQRQLADGQARYQRVLALARLERNAIALTADLNPTAQPNGVMPLAGGRQLRWQAEALSAPALNTGSRQSGRAYELRLYRLDLTIVGADGAPLGQFAYDRVGWRRLVAPAPFVPPPPPPARPTPPAGLAPFQPAQPSTAPQL
jgi:prepilin-type N-terminal cleavage/methylation domain-containing protein